MAKLDYGYEITIAQNATVEGSNATPTNQWQKQNYGMSSWNNISGATKDTYFVSTKDRSARIRLEQDIDGAKIYSNALEVTDVEWKPESGLGEIGPDWGLTPANNGPKWFGGVLAPNGKIFCIPHSASSIIVIDPSNDSVRALPGNTGNEPKKWAGGVLHPNGKIYGIPHDADYFLEIDPVSETWTILTGYPKEAQVTYIGGIYNPDTGYIVCMPDRGAYATAMLFDPLTHEIKKVNQTQNGFNAPVYAGDGLAYCAKGGGGYWGKLDADSGVLTAERIDREQSGYGGVIGWLGNIFFAPNAYNTWQVMWYDIEKDEVKSFGVLPGSSENQPDKYRGAVAAPDAFIYAIPYNATKILKIDPVSLTFTSFGEYPGEGSYCGATLAQNGVIYMIPGSVGRVSKLYIGAEPGPTWPYLGGSITTLDPLHPAFNKF